VVGTGFGNANLLMPAVLATDVIGLHRKGEVLMYPAVFPEDSLRIGVIAFERLDSVNVAHHPLTRLDLFQIDQSGGPAFATGIFLQPPTAEMMRAGDDSGFDPFRDPHFVHEVTDLRVHF